MDNKEKIDKRLEEAEKTIQELESERTEYLNGWKRAKADLVNFKREIAESVGATSSAAIQRLVTSLIPALEALEEAEKNNIDGLAEIQTLLLKGLQEQGVYVINPAPGDDFDPRLHEAAGGTGEKIERVLRRGYALDATTIKPAMVFVKNE